MIELPAEPGGVHPHVVCASCESPQLIKEQRHHLEKVRRVRKGDLLSVTDGKGQWRWCEFGDELTPVSEIQKVDEPPLITIGISLTKGSKPDLAITKMVEIGVRRIIPFVSDRSVVQWDEEKTQKNQERFERLVTEAVQQSRQVWLPEVKPLSTFADLAQLPTVVRADRFAPPARGDETFVLIGPEGGWSEAEQEKLPAVSFGTSVLRAETAAIVVAARLMASHQSHGSN